MTARRFAKVLGSLTVIGVTVPAQALAGPVRQITADPLAFGSVVQGTASAVQTVTIKNTGTGRLSPDTPRVTGADRYDFLITDGCGGAALAAGDACVIRVRFAPSRTGDETATLVLAANATFPLTGTGAAVPAGPTGPAGAAGDAGPTGDTGAAGAAGATGPQGAAGANGTNGTDGGAGPTGPTGPAGAAGAAGPTGAAGVKGSAGPTGAAGPLGPTGAAGPAGERGPKGARGPAGPAKRVVCKTARKSGKVRVVCHVTTARRTFVFRVNV